MKRPGQARRSNWRSVRLTEREQIAQTLPGKKQSLKGFNLIDNIEWRKIIELVKAQLNVQFAAIISQTIFNLYRQTR